MRPSAVDKNANIARRHVGDMWRLPNWTNANWRKTLASDIRMNIYKTCLASVGFPLSSPVDHNITNFVDTEYTDRNHAVMGRVISSLPYFISYPRYFS